MVLKIPCAALSSVLQPRCSCIACAINVLAKLSKWCCHHTLCTFLKGPFSKLSRPAHENQMAWMWFRGPCSHRVSKALCDPEPFKWKGWLCFQCEPDVTLKKKTPQLSLPYNYCVNTASVRIHCRLTKWNHTACVLNVCSSPKLFTLLQLTSAIFVMFARPGGYSKLVGKWCTWPVHLKEMVNMLIE